MHGHLDVLDTLCGESSPDGLGKAASLFSDHLLEELLDLGADVFDLRAELGVSRAAAEAIMRAVPRVTIPGLRKTYGRRSEVARLLEARTFAENQVPA